MINSHKCNARIPQNKINFLAILFLDANSQGSLISEDAGALSTVQLRDNIQILRNRLKALEPMMNRDELKLNAEKYGHQKNPILKSIRAHCLD